jgi:hypothetical protein
MFCLHCGRELMDQARFCLSCGTHHHGEPQIKRSWHYDEPASELVKELQVVRALPKWIVPFLVVMAVLMLGLLLAINGRPSVSSQSLEGMLPTSKIPSANLKVTRSGSVRTSPFADAGIIKQVRSGDVLAAGAMDGQWTRVSWTGGQGWIETASLTAENKVADLTKRGIDSRAKQEEEYKQRSFQKLVASYHDSGFRRIDDAVVVRIEWDDESWHQIPLKTKQGIFDTFKFITHRPVRIVGHQSGDTLAKIGLLSDTIN